MRQFTVYGPDQQQGFSPAYVVAFTQDGPVAYAMNDDWEDTASDLERRLNTNSPHSENKQPDPQHPRRMQ